MSKKITITVPGELPGMNDILAQSKSHYAEYSKFKKQYTTLVQLCARHKERIDRANVTITWYCKDQRRDKDNIMAGAKFVFDGLVKAGVLPDDRWKQIGDITHRFEVDKRNPRVEIVLTEVEVEAV